MSIQISKEFAGGRSIDLESFEESRFSRKTPQGHAEDFRLSIRISKEFAFAYGEYASGHLAFFDFRDGRTDVQLSGQHYMQAYV